jgi:hypothetical protein
MRRIEFPSVAWFKQLRALMHADEARFKELGPCDCTMVAKIDPDPWCSKIDAQRSKLYEIAFADFGVQSIREIRNLAEAASSHFVLEAPLGVWREMLENIHWRHAPDQEHTLNYLTLPDDPMRVTGPDQLETDAFYRFNETLQRFFNGSARVETRYP